SSMVTDFTTRPLAGGSRGTQFKKREAGTFTGSWTTILSVIMTQSDCGVNLQSATSKSTRHAGAVHSLRNCSGADLALATTRKTAARRLPWLSSCRYALRVVLTARGSVATLE